jgi:hypothetical protein
VLPALPALWISAALAGTVHSGVPIEGYEGFEPPRFQSSRAGFTMDFPGGIARVYVGQTEAAAQEWYGETLVAIARQKPHAIDDLGDEAAAGKDEVVLVRDGNIGILVQVKAGARSKVELLMAAIVDDGSPWPTGPGLSQEGERWVLTGGPDIRSLAWRGGRLDPVGTGPMFTRPPHQGIAWDALGRAAVQDFGPLGSPVDTPPVRPAPDWIPPAPAPTAP